MTTALSAFAVAATLLILAPGPDSLLVIRNTLRAGSRVGFATTAGTLTGLFSWAVAAGLGLSAVLAASRVGYDVLRGESPRLLLLLQPLRG
jgi:threonine/homoserine/homoserine lactone efflux protein